MSISTERYDHRSQSTRHLDESFPEYHFGDGRRGTRVGSDLLYDDIYVADDGTVHLGETIVRGTVNDLLELRAQIDTALQTAAERATVAP